MYDILKGPDRFSRALPMLPYRRKTMETLQHNLDKVIDYRRTLKKPVNGSHLLLRYLGSLNVSLTLPAQAYVDKVTDLALMLSSSLHLTSAWGGGRVFNPGIVYGPDISEVIVVSTDTFDVEAAAADWENLEPLRVLDHPYNDFTLPFLDGSGRGLSGSGWTVLVLNAPMLALQHKCWWEKFVDGSRDSPPGDNVFFNSYPLANLLRSHMDITLANRLMATALDRPIYPQEDPNPFYMKFWQDRVDLVIRDALTFMKRRTGLSFDDWISAVPMLTVEDYHERLELPDLAYLTQVEWAFFLARLPILSFLLAFNAESQSRFNNQYINRIRHWVRRMRGGRLFAHGLRGDTAEQVADAIAQRIDPYL